MLKGFTIKKFLKPLWRVLLVIAVFEGFSYILTAYLYGITSPLHYRENYETGVLKNARFSFDEVGARDYWQFEEAHPYFGFQLTERWAGFNKSYPPNNQGFRSRLDYPYIKKPGEYVIGIFGSSVAQFFTEQMIDSGYFEREIKKKVPQLRDKKIVLLDFGLGGAKQPQQFIISAFFADTVDFAINIDGFADIVLEAPLNYPIEFPITADFLYGQKVQSLPFVAKIEWYKSLSRALAAPARRIPVLALSPTYYLFWSTCSALFDHEAAQLQSEMRGYLAASAKPFTTPSGPRLAIGHEREAQRYEVWKKFSWLQHENLKASGKPHLFFLQPILAYHSLINEEQKKFLIPYAGVDNTYQYLDEHSRLESKAGLPVVGLFNIFENSTGVFKDLVHLTPKGYDEMADKIIQAMAPNVK